MNVLHRLLALERRVGDRDWCRCPFSWERSMAELAGAHATGEPTPAVCERCLGRRIPIQFVPMDPAKGRLRSRAEGEP